MAGIDRLFLFMKAIQELDSDRSNDDSEVIAAVKDGAPPELPDGILVKEFDTRISSAPQVVLNIRNLRLTTPDNKRVLIDSLNLKLSKGQNLLISGVSGAGKSSLLRAIAGLWRSGDGEITRARDVYFLPQRPYCPPGSLRDQLLYPSKGQVRFSDETNLSSWTDEDLLAILATVDLPDLAARCGDGDPIRGLNSFLDFSNILSLGEQQRLAFGRLLVNRPRLVIMDESTSALDVVAEKRMFTLIKEELSYSGGDTVTYVSVGHRPTLMGKF